MPVFEVGPIDERIVYAFLIGFLLTFLIMGIRILFIKSKNKKLIKKLKTSLSSRIELEAVSLGNMKKEIESLKTENSNLKTSLQNLSVKVGRREKLQLQIYQTAIEKMSVRAPGFAPAWHVVLKECEDEMGKSLEGTIPFVKRIIPAVGSGWKDSAFTESTQGEEPKSDTNFEATNVSNKKTKTLKIASIFSRKK